MLAAGIRPDAQAYNSLINAYSKVDMTDKAIQVLQKMELTGIKPNSVTFNTLIDSCARSGNVTRAQEMFRVMQSKGVSPDERLSTSCLFKYLFVILLIYFRFLPHFLPIRS